MKLGESVRCTVVVWGDDVPDALRIAEPIPSGFEFVESEKPYGANEQVRDGEVVDYFLNVGEPCTFHYYLRPENAGSLVALPATAEYLRRPAFRGHSTTQPIEVKAPG